MPSERKNKAASVYFIVPAPAGISPGQRFRFEHYLGHLRNKGIKFRLSNFYSLKAWHILYTPGNKASKIFYVLSGLTKRFIDLFRAAGYSYVYVYREAAPVGPPFFEWLMSRVFRKKIIYDFDDAIWIPVTSEFNKTASAFKNFGKVAKICKWSYRISVGNEYLRQYAAQFNPNVVIIPTVVDTDDSHSGIQNHDTDKPNIGWTGTFSTLKYLDIVLPVLSELQSVYDFTFIVIADKDPGLSLKKYQFVKWSREKEAEDLLRFHIGLMPLYDDEISKGKCGFKAIQYMSLGIPSVVSPVGVNSRIVDDGINGFVCKDEKDWKEKIELLLKDNRLRKQMGAGSQKKIQQHYSVKATAELFTEHFKQ